MMTPFGGYVSKGHNTAVDVNVLKSGPDVSVRSLDQCEQQKN